MKYLAIFSLLVSAIPTACENDNDSSKFIHPDKTEMNIILGTEGYLNIAYNAGFTHYIDDTDITTLKSTEKHADGNMTLVMMGHKLGKTQIHLMEGETNNYEVVVNINCKILSGIWREGCEDLDSKELIQTQVIVSDAQIKEKIEQEILAEALQSLNKTYVFSDNDMTFKMNTRDGVAYSGYYDQTDNFITLRYTNKTEKWFIVNSSRCYFIYLDYTEKFKDLYPNAGIHTVSCRRCLSVPQR